MTLSTSSAFAVSMMIGTVASGAQAAADLEAVELGQHQVEDDEVERPLGEATRAGLPVRAPA